MASIVRRLIGVPGFIALFAIAGALAFSAQGASGQGTGFTGDINYTCNVLPPGFACGPTALHSYGFNSAHYSGNGRWTIGTIITDTPLGTYSAFVSEPTRIARVCTNGTYPNCIDSDGWAGHVWVETHVYTHTVDGHGVY